jgi:hypothetical protein
LLENRKTPLKNPGERLLRPIKIFIYPGFELGALMKNLLPVPGPGVRMGRIQILGIFFLIQALIIPVVLAPADPVNVLQNISGIVPVTGPPSGNSTGAMAQYMEWLNSIAAPMMSFFNQITSVFGGGQGLTGNTSGDLQKSLQQFLTPGNGSATIP